MTGSRGRGTESARSAVGLAGQLADLIRRRQPVVVLTGAGISTESGLPDFRGRGAGLWSRVDPMRLSASALRRDPTRFWKVFAEIFGMAPDIEPNRGHLALAALERAGYIRSVITQNIDGLHQMAGSTRVLEIHGHLRTASCTRCGRRIPLAEALAQLDAREVPQCSCGTALRPDAVLFEDPMPPDFDQARAEAAACRLLLVVGSSLTVWPAASLVDYAPRLAVVNDEPTPADPAAEVVIHGSAGQTLSAVAERLGV